MYQAIHGFDLSNIFVLPVSFQYVCHYWHCPRMNDTKDEDWGYYSKTNNNCTFCTNKCDNDANCAGVECGSPKNYCSWWKQGKCVTEAELTKEDYSYKTCIKHQIGE